MPRQHRCLRRVVPVVNHQPTSRGRGPPLMARTRSWPQPRSPGKRRCGNRALLSTREWVFRFPLAGPLREEQGSQIVGIELSSQQDAYAYGRESRQT
jgi:hypothetical protein